MLPRDITRGKVAGFGFRDNKDFILKVSRHGSCPLIVTDLMVIVHYKLSLHFSILNYLVKLNNRGSAAHFSFIPKQKVNFIMNMTVM